MTLKLFAHIWRFERICAFQTYGFIVVSHWLSMCWLILANFDEELPKQEDVCDTAKDTEHIYCVCMYLVYCGATTQIMVNSYL